jgi:hypothetical protein
LFKISRPEKKEAIAKRPRQIKNKGLKLCISDMKKKNKGASPRPAMIKQKANKCLKPILDVSGLMKMIFCSCGFRLKR